MYRFFLYDRQQLVVVNGVNQIGQTFCQVSVPKTFLLMTVFATLKSKKMKTR